MRRGIPTILVILLCISALTYWSWRAGGGQTAEPASGIVTSRPIPAEGWGAMRVMTANIRIDDPVDGDNGWVHRRELLTRTLLKYQPDILACQEVTPAQGAYLNKQLAEWYSYYPRGGVGPASSSGTRSATAELLGALNESLASLNTLYYRSDRFEILDGEAGLVLPDQPQSNPAENTFFTLAILQERRPDDGKRANPGTIIVVDVHFRQVEAFALQCADRIHQKIATWSAKYPRSGILLLGDMNRDRTTKLYANLTAADAANAAGSLHDLFDYTATPAGGIGGGPNNGGNYHHFTGQTGRAWPTDLIFVGGTLKSATPSEIVRDKGVEGHYPSDHFFTQASVGW